MLTSYCSRSFRVALFEVLVASTHGGICLALGSQAQTTTAQHPPDLSFTRIRCIPNTDSTGPTHSPIFAADIRIGKRLPYALSAFFRLRDSVARARKSGSPKHMSLLGAKIARSIECALQCISISLRFSFRFSRLKKTLRVLGSP